MSKKKKVNEKDTVKKVITNDTTVHHLQSGGLLLYNKRKNGFSYVPVEESNSNEL